MIHRRSLPLAIVAATLASHTPAQWLEVHPATQPAARTNPSMAFTGGDTLLFGGANLGGFPPTNFADTWRWNGTDWLQLAPANAPSGRHFAAMAHDQQRGRTVLYGGISSTLIGGTYQNDTWEWDGTNWSQVPTANSPGGYLGTNGVKEHSMAYDMVGQRVVMFGGELFQGIVPAANRTFEFDGTNWIQTTPAQSPPRRAQASLCSAPTLGGVLLFGGTNFNNPPGPNGEVVWNDTWLYSSLTDTWTRLALQGPQPPARAGAFLQFDYNTGLYVLYGGYISSQTGALPLNDTWVFDGTNWIDLSAVYGGPSTPRVRFGGSEGPGGLHVMFGGAPGFTGQPVAETWLQGPLAEAAMYGAGCNGGNGVPILSASNRPVLGTTFQLLVANLPPGASFVFQMVGFSDTISPLGPLPLSLQPFGLGSGCNLLQSAEAVSLAAVGGGPGTLSFPLTSTNPALAGLVFHYQIGSLDPQAPGGFAVSNGMRARFGLY